MDEALRKVCETYIANRNEMRRILESSGAPMHLMGAAVLTALGKTPDESKILAAERMLKEKEPEDSPIRGRIKSVTTVHMMLADDMEKYYNDLRRTHDLIHVNRGGDDERYYMAAMMMSEKIADMQQILMMVDRTSTIHEGMGKSFTSQEDRSSYVLAAFAAACGVVNTREYLDKVRECKEILAESAAFGEVVPEDLCMLLSIVPTEDNRSVCDAVLKTLDAIKRKGMDFSSDEEAAMLPFLSLLDMDADEVAQDVYDADEFLSIHSGFNDGDGIVLRRVYASMLVTMTYAMTRSFPKLKEVFTQNPEILKHIVLVQSQSVMHIQMEYVDIKDLHI